MSDDDKDNNKIYIVHFPYGKIKRALQASTKFTVKSFKSSCNT